MTTTAEAPVSVMTTAGLYDAFLKIRDSKKFDPKEIRLSEVGGCARKQTLRILGYEAQELSQQQRSIFHAGDEHEAAIFHLWASNFPRQVKRQIDVKTPYGIGHIDIWVAPILHMIESKSCKATAKPYLPHQEHIDQVMLYLHYWVRQRGGTAEIAYRLKETGEILSFPVVYDEARALHLIGVLDAIEVAVMNGEVLPIPKAYKPGGFPCSWATGDDRVFCGYFQHCWPAEVEDDAKEPFAEVAALTGELAAYHELHGRYADAKARVDSLEEALKHRRIFLGEVMARNGVNVLRAGDIRIKRTVRKGSLYYRMGDAIKAGVVSEEVLAPFQFEKSGGELWTVKLDKPKEVA